MLRCSKKKEPGRAVVGHAQRPKHAMTPYSGNLCHVTCRCVFERAVCVFAAFVCVLSQIARELAAFVCVLPCIARKLAAFVCVLPYIARGLAAFVCVLPYVARELAAFVCVLPCIARVLLLSSCVLVPRLASSFGPDVVFLSLTRTSHHFGPLRPDTSPLRSDTSPLRPDTSPLFSQTRAHRKKNNEPTIGKSNEPTIIHRSQTFHLFILSSFILSSTIQNILKKKFGKKGGKGG